MLMGRNRRKYMVDERHGAGGRRLRWKGRREKKENIGHCK